MTTADHILAAAETLLVSSGEVDCISVRRIADIAGVNASAINYHFGSREQLLLAAVQVIYRRFNRERLQLLRAAIDARAPEPPELAGVIAALVGPSVAGASTRSRAILPSSISRRWVSTFTSRRWARRSWGASIT